MKKLKIILTGLVFSTFAFGQQFPSMEGYNINLYSLSSAYTGLSNIKTVFADYRSDWTGMSGGPVTYQLSYNDRVGEKVGLGGKFVYDRTDIFKQVILLGTYAYDLEMNKEHHINLALSMGFFSNSIDIGKYFNDPDYVQDQVLMYGSDNSKIKFATDISALYHFRELDAGILFSNIMFGTARYKNNSLTYKPLKNFQIHTSYNFRLGEKWDLRPAILLRGGQNVPMQLEIAPSAMWKKSIWAALIYRTGGVIGGSFGGEIYNGLMLNYSYNLSTRVAMNTFGGHQVTLGVRLVRLKPASGETAVVSE